MRASCILICVDCEMVTHYPSNEQVRQDIVLICCLVLSVETDIPITTKYTPQVRKGEMSFMKILYLQNWLSVEYTKKFIL